MIAAQHEPTPSLEPMEATLSFADINDVLVQCGELRLKQSALGPTRALSLDLALYSISPLMR